MRNSRTMIGVEPESILSHFPCPVTSRVDPSGSQDVVFVARSPDEPPDVIHVLPCFVAVVLLLYLLQRVHLERNDANRLSVHELVDSMIGMNFP